MTQKHDICLLFVSDSGTLKVYMRSGPSEEGLMFSSNSSGRSWTRFSQSVERNTPFQVTRNMLSGRHKNKKKNGYFINNVH